MSWHNNLGWAPKGVKKNQDDRSRKLCVCGGHNMKNVKCNLHHNATRKKLFIKLNRKWKRRMKRSRLHDLLRQNPEVNLEWTGKCHDCKKAVTIMIEPKEDGIHILNGAIYEPQANIYYIKCDKCYKKEPVLKNYQNNEVYSRVVGYLRPVSQWNQAKQEEFKDRKLFDKDVERI